MESDATYWTSFAHDGSERGPKPIQIAPATPQAALARWKNRAKRCRLNAGFLCKRAIFRTQLKRAVTILEVPDLIPEPLPENSSAR